MIVCHCHAVRAEEIRPEVRLGAETVELVEDLLAGEEHHADWLEGQLHVIEQAGIEQAGIEQAGIEQAGIETHLAQQIRN